MSSKPSSIGPSERALPEVIRSKLSTILSPEELAHALTTGDVNSVLPKTFRALPLEEQEKLIEAFVRRVPDDKQMDCRNNFIFLQFQSMEYFELVNQAIQELETGDVFVGINLLWEAFTQASALGSWGPGRFQLLHLLLAKLYMQNDNFVLPYARKMRHLACDKNELVTIRMIAAGSFGSCLPPITLMSSEEKWGIIRSTAKLVPPREELSRHVVSRYDNNKDKDNFVDSVMDIFYYYQKTLEEILKKGPKTEMQCTESIPVEVDPELHRRTSEIGGFKCDFCHATVEELGVAQLKLCGKCQNAYYCGAECQLKAWKNGHKKACRPVLDVHEGDIMRLVGLKSSPQLNSRLVKVVEKIPKSRRWLVHMLAERDPGDDTSKPFSVKTSNLLQIRPAA